MNQAASSKDSPPLPPRGVGSTTSVRSLFVWACCLGLPPLVWLHQETVQSANLDGSFHHFLDLAHLIKPQRQQERDGKSPSRTDRKGGKLHNTSPKHLLDLPTPDDPMLTTKVLSNAAASKSIHASPPSTPSLKPNRTNMARGQTDCGCPETCDDIAMKRIHRNQRSCQLVLKELLHQNKFNETDACIRAVEEKETCGMECHPVHCHNQTAMTPVPFDWSRVQNVDPPLDKPFVRYDGVVIATKVFGPSHIHQVEQWLCLFTAAYNRHVNYDVIVFTTLPWPDKLVQLLQAIAPQTNVSVIVEGPPLHERVAALTPDQREYLHQRCNVTNDEGLSWDHLCSDGTFVHPTRLSYAWQAEFRAYHIWNMPVLAPYKYMMWLDTDALCSKPWRQDPIKSMVEHDLVLMFANHWGDVTRNPAILDKMQKVYNRTICKLGLNEQGQYHVTTMCKPDEVAIRIVYGFHHVTNLDFYRSPPSIDFLRVLVETHPYSREWDDQLAVTIPAAIGAPDRVWDYHSHGINISLYHNRHLDGRGPLNVPEDRKAFQKYWEEDFVRGNWPSAREMCDRLVVYSG